MKRYLMRLHRSRPFTKVLHVGCGYGDLTKWLTFRPEVTLFRGIDINENRIEECRYRNHDKPRVDYFLANWRNMVPDPLQPHELFDCVIVSAPFAPDLVERCMMVLVPTGRLIYQPCEMLEPVALEK